MTGNAQYPSTVLREAVEAMSSLPGVGSRSALRLTLHLLRQPEGNIRHFAEAIGRLACDVRYCRECMMVSDNDVCPICSDRKRDHHTICVVESIRDVMSIEETGQYHGVYHVLGGIISPINGIGPSDLNIRQLVARVATLTGKRSGMEGDTGAGNGGEPGGNIGHAFAGSSGTGNGEAGDEGGDSGHCFTGSSGTGNGEVGDEGGDSRDVEVILALSGDVEGETTSFYIYRQLGGLGCKVSTLARGLGFGDDLEYADSLTLGRSIINRQEFRP